jgi:inner membrane protein
MNDGVIRFTCGHGCSNQKLLSALVHSTLTQTARVIVKVNRGAGIDWERRLHHPAMPSPVGHSLAALIIYRTTNRFVGCRSWQLISLYVLAANAPDLDFIPGLIVGDLSRFHHGPSHSIGAAVLFGLITAFFVPKPLYGFLVAFSLYFSHVVLDYCIQDPSPPQGVPLLWPISSEYYMAPFAFFPRFDYAPRPGESLVSAVLTFHNLAVMLTEFIIFLPLLYCACRQKIGISLKFIRRF